MKSKIYQRVEENNNQRRRYSARQLINLAVYGLIDYGQLITEVEHGCELVFHPVTCVTQALVLPADRTGNMPDTEQFITHCCHCLLPHLFLCSFTA